MPIPDSWTQKQRVLYARGTGYKTHKRKGRCIPPHIIRQMAKPDKFDILGTDGQEEGPVAKDAPDPKYYAKFNEPTFRCELCSEVFKLEHVRYHRPIALKPEQLVCSFCYKELDLAETNTQPADSANQAIGHQPTSPPIKAVSIEDKGIIAASMIREHFPATIELELAIQTYIIKVTTKNKHGAAYLELFFDRDHMLCDLDNLIQDFMDSQDDQEHPEADYPEVIYEV